MTIELSENEVPVYPFRYKLKIPQMAFAGQSFDDSDDSENTKAWRRQKYDFKAGKYYSVAKFHGTVFNNNEDEFRWNDNYFEDGFFGLTETDPTQRQGDAVNVVDRDPNSNVAIIETGYYKDLDNSVTDMVSNVTEDDRDFFIGNWLNFSIHLPQNGYLANDTANHKSMRSNTNFTMVPKKDHFYVDNQQKIAAGDVNTKHFARSDLHLTDFVETEQGELRYIYNSTRGKKGFTNIYIDNINLRGEYKKGDNFVPSISKNGTTIPLGGGGKKDVDPNEDIDPNIYFYKGLDTADCLQYLNELNLL